MLVADSSMAVGLAIFLPTAWANGCRAPCGKKQARITGRRQACAEVQVYKMYYGTEGGQAKGTEKTCRAGEEAAIVISKWGTGIEYSRTT